MIGSTHFVAPFVITSGISRLAACAIYAFTPSTRPALGRDAHAVHSAGDSVQTIRLLLLLTMIVTAAIGVFEVGLALRANQTLQMDATTLALMFSECSIVMFVAQAVVFSPRVKPETTPPLVAPALLVMAGGVALASAASSLTILLAVADWISLGAGRAQGAQLGKKSAVANLGQAIGSVSVGYLFTLYWLPSAPFVLMATFLAVFAFLARRGARRLLPFKTSDFASAV